MLRDGERLQQYLIEKKVAKGGMGWLFKAQHTTLKMPVAIKVLMPHHSEDPELRGRFLNEARIQCRLKHPYIVQVTDTIEVDKLLGIVMEWVEGGALMGYMHRQGELLSFQQIWAIMSPVLEALQYAHEKGVIHRDIKPDNILLQQDGELIIPKISDFGLAKLERGLSHNWTKDGEALGSIRYMPPEQIRNTKGVDHRADIYSLGVVLYFMACGKFPFSGTPQELLYSHISQTPPRPQEINPAVSFQFEDVILCCLQKDPDNRFQSCRELLAALSEVSLEYMSPSAAAYMGQPVTRLARRPPIKALNREPEAGAEPTALIRWDNQGQRTPTLVKKGQHHQGDLAETLPPGHTASSLGIDASPNEPPAPRPHTAPPTALTPPTAQAHHHPSQPPPMTKRATKRPPAPLQPPPSQTQHPHHQTQQNASPQRGIQISGNQHTSADLWAGNAGSGMTQRVPFDDYGEDVTLVSKTKK